MASQPSTMQTVRRLYLYVMAGVSLSFVAVCIVNLLGLALDILFRGVTAHGWLQGGTDWERNRISLYVPLLAIAAPIWLLHWRMIQREWNATPTNEERQSVIRALYLTAILSFTAPNFLSNLLQIVRLFSERAFGRVLETYERDEIVGSMATVFVAALIWVAHNVVRNRDERFGPLEGASAWIPRLSRYVVAAIGATFLMFGTARLIRVAVDGLLGAGQGWRWWTYPLSDGVAMVLAGGLVWAIYWIHSMRLLRGDAWLANSEQYSRIRGIYLIGLLTFTTIVTLVYTSGALEHVVWQILTPADTHSRPEQLRGIIAPILATTPFVAFWVFHRTRIVIEASFDANQPRPTTTRRVYEYSLACVGQAFAIFGLATVVASALLRITGTSDWVYLGLGGWQGQVALGSATSAAGGFLWLWHWRRVLQRMSTELPSEQASTVRRAYLFIVLGSTLIVLIVSVAIVIYQILQRVLDVEGVGSLAEDISRPVGFAVVAILVAAYHGLLLRRDLIARPADNTHEAKSVPAQITVVITGPANTDLTSLVATLRSQLPAGHRMTVTNDRNQTGATN